MLLYQRLLAEIKYVVFGDPIIHHVCGSDDISISSSGDMRSSNQTAASINLTPFIKSVATVRY